MRRKIINKSGIICMLMFGLLSTNVVLATSITENPVLWGKIAIQFEGPELNETSANNPFTDYRMDVTFTSPNGSVFLVPGYFAADGNASETSAESGSVWQVNFAANDTGIWSYDVSFVKGNQVAADLSGGISAEYFDGESGTFTVAENNFETLDFKSKGKLEYVDEHFLQFQGNKEYYIKAGANSPEVFLEYQEFDNTPSDRLYPDFVNDWNESDPSWQDGKGKGIIGVVNYLSSIDINGYYFLTMNAYGDGKKAWPWINKDSLVRYDCSKLDQWDVVFQHMNAKGVMVHFVLTETENEALFELEEFGEADGFANSRKIYFREMVARFGYLPAVTWNVGEENGWAEGDGYHLPNTDQQRKDFCDRLRELSYYNDHISIHNGPSTDDYIFEELLGHTSFTGPAFQWDFGVDIFNILYKWRTKSAEAGHKWIMSLDEPYVNPPTGDLNKWRTDNIWPTFMAGCAGIELYIGQGYDLTVQDFRTYEPFYTAMTVAANFFRENLPFQALVPDTSFCDFAHTLRIADSIFVLYMPTAHEAVLDLPSNKYKIEWFDPKNGGAPVYGSTHFVSGANQVDIGKPFKNEENDWVCILTHINDDQSFLDISIPVIENTTEEGNRQEANSDTVLISVLGDEVVDSVWVEVQNGAWIDYTIIANDNQTWQIVISLNDAVNDLKINHYQAAIGVYSASAAPVFVNYSLDVIYNLNGHNYFYADNGIAVMEIESNPLLSQWVSADNEPGFSGDSYYFYDGPFVSEPIDTNVFEYYFYVPRASKYVVGIHNFIPNTDFTENNDTWLKMDDERWWKHFSHTNQIWNWETQLDDGDENFYDPEWELAEGFHVLRIGGRSDKFYLDKIHVYKTTLKDQFVYDVDLLQSGQSDRDDAIISISWPCVFYNYKEGAIPQISNRNINVKNAGVGVLDPVKASCDAEFVNVDISGEENAQKLTISYTEAVKDLTVGTYEYSVLLNADNASTRELRLYFNIAEPVGIRANEALNSISLKSTLVNNQIEFVTSENIEANIQVINMNGQLVLSKALKNVSESSIAVYGLESGVYFVQIHSKYGTSNQKFVKQ